MAGIVWKCEYCNDEIGLFSYCTKPTCVIAARKDGVVKLEAHLERLEEAIRTMQGQANGIKTQLALLKQFI